MPKEQHIKRRQNPKKDRKAQRPRPATPESEYGFYGKVRRLTDRSKYPKKEGA